MTTERGKQARAECIKEYQDEDSLAMFENGEIDEEEIIVYKVGCYDYVVDGYYDEEYWKKL